MRFLILVAALGLAACSAKNQPASAPSATASASVGCVGLARSVWDADAATKISFTATADGPSCANAVATLAARGADGKVLFVDVAPSADLMTLHDKPSAEAMNAGLLEWIDPKNAAKTTADLPVWPKGAPQPPGEFPFYPEDAYDQVAYEALRKQALPVFCYVQGMESLSCLVLQDGGLNKVGVQAFPG
jgi:hypothetical protein